MRYVQKAIYKFNELSAKAKENAKHKYSCIFGYEASEDAMETIRKLAEYFCCKIKSYEVDFFNSMHSSMEFETNLDQYEDEPAIQNALREMLDQLGEYDPETLRGLGDCKLTGYFIDEDAIDGFRKAWHAGERNLPALMESAFLSWLKSAQEDCAAFYEDENFSDHCDANDYEFDEDGNSV